MSHKLPRYPRLMVYYEEHFNLKDMTLEEFKGELDENPYLAPIAQKSLEEWFKKKSGYEYRKHGSGKYGYVRIKRGKWFGHWIW